jgi:glucokinase
VTGDIYVGIDLGGTNIHAAVGNAAGELAAEANVPTNAHQGPAAVLQRMADVALQLVQQTDGTVTAIGVGCPGLVDIDQGHARFFPNMPTHWRDVDVAGSLSAQCGCPVQLLNDVRTATLGELAYGRGRQRERISMAFFSIGTGIGGGLVHQGNLVLGSLGAAGELGHQTILPEGPRCGCGNRGCLETLASGSAISAAGVRLLRSGLAPQLFDLVGGDANLVTPQVMATAADQGDTLVGEAIDDAASFLGIAAANVVSIFHPQLIVLGGGVANLGERLRGRVEETIRRRVGMFPTADVRVEVSALGSRAGVLGAIALASGKLVRT